MDGEVTPTIPAEFAPARRRDHLPPSRSWRVAVFALVAVFLAALLYGFYWFNAYRAQAIASFFANNKPPPAQIAAVTATKESVPLVAGSYRLRVSGSGSLSETFLLDVDPGGEQSFTVSLGQAFAQPVTVDLQPPPERRKGSSTSGAGAGP